MLKSYIRPKRIIKQSTSTTLNQITLQAMYSYHGSVVFCYNESSASLTPWSKVLYHGLHEACNIETHSQDIGHKEQEANTTPKLWTQGSADHVLHRVKDNYWLI